ncbi:hypothetical protein MRX96_024526 [Rhipicephalus microplus]
MSRASASLRQRPLATRVTVVGAATMRHEESRTFEGSTWPASNACAGSSNAFACPESPNATLRATELAQLAVVCCRRCTITVRSRRKGQDSTQTKVSNRDAVCKCAVVFILFNTQETYVAVSGVDGWDCRKWSSFLV